MLSELGSDPKFFARWRSECIEFMTLIEVLPEGELYFYHSQHCGAVWVVVGAHSVIVAYRGLEYDITQIRHRVTLWDRARQDGVKPAGDIGFGAVYAATEDPSTKALTVSWFSPGDWLGIPRVAALTPQSNQLPSLWPETYRERLNQLARDRSSRRERRED
jgi:hypothetical protein